MSKGAITLKISESMRERFLLMEKKRDLDLVVENLDRFKSVQNSIRVCEQFESPLKKITSFYEQFESPFKKYASLYERITELSSLRERIKRAVIGESFSSDSWKSRKALSNEKALDEARRLRNKISKLLSRINKALLMMNSVNGKTLLNKIGIKRIRQMLSVSKDEEEIFGLRLEDQIKLIFKSKILNYEQERITSITKSISV